MNNQTARAYLESMLNAYKAGGVITDLHEQKYRLIWLSEMDAEALEVVIKELEHEHS